MIHDNTARREGGGVTGAGGEIANSFVDGNAAGDGGGVYARNTRLRSTTITGNRATQRYGGAYFYSGHCYNSIVYYNSAPQDSDYGCNNSTLVRSLNCCFSAVPIRSDVIITNPPALAGAANPHLMAASPCIAAGTNAFANDLPYDIDVEPRIAPAGGITDTAVMSSSAQV
jgi:hypothetical protein